MLALSPRVAAEDFFEFSPLSRAFNQSQQFHVLPTSGTLGTGMEFRSDITKNLNIRFAYSSMDYAKSTTNSTVSYDLKLKMFSRSMIVDWRPFGGSFRTSAGVIFGGPSLTGAAFSVDTLGINGTTVTGGDVQNAVSGISPTSVISYGQWTISGADVLQYTATINSSQSVSSGDYAISESEFGSVSGIARYPDNAPYFGIGWGNIAARKSRLLYSVDLGVMYIGRPKVELTLHGPVAQLTDKYYSAETRAYLAEEQQKMEASLSKYRYFPVFSVAMWYSF